MKKNTEHFSDDPAEDRRHKLSYDQKEVLKRLCLIMLMSHFVIACGFLPWMLLSDTVLSNLLYFLMTGAYTLADAICLTVTADMVMRDERRMALRCAMIYTGAQALSSLIISSLNNYDTMFHTHELDFIILSSLWDVVVEIIYAAVFLGVFFAALYRMLRRTPFASGRRRCSYLISVLLFISLFTGEIFDTVQFFSQVGTTATVNEVLYIIMTYLIYGIFAALARKVSMFSYNMTDKFLSVPDYLK